MKILLFVALLIAFMSPAYADFQGRNVLQPYLYKFTSSPTVTSTVKLGSGILHTFTVEGGTSSTINIYDGSTTVNPLIASYAATNTPQTYTFDIAFSSGCTVVTNGAIQYTVSYL